MMTIIAMPRRRWRACTVVGVLVACALLAVGLLACADGPSSSGSGPRIAAGSLPNYYGPWTLEERIVSADVIARVRLRSTAPVVEQGVWRYGGALDFTFDALEYLKGSGGSELKAFTLGPSHYLTKSGASLAAAGLLSKHDTRWDDREAIVFLRKHDNLPGTKQTDRYWLGSIDIGRGHEYYSIASRHNQLWLPDAAPPGAGGLSGESGGDSGEQRFLLDAPQEAVAPAGAEGAIGQSETSETPTIALSALKELVAALEAEVAAGGTSTAYTAEEYRDCVYEKYAWARKVQYKMEKDGWYHRYAEAAALTSGLPAGTFTAYHPSAGSVLANAGPTDPGNVMEMWIGGEDEELFSSVWPGAAETVRPLPAGKYRFFYDLIPHWLGICDGQPQEEKERFEWAVTVTAREGTVHEAFFDPVAEGSSVVADDYRGQLSPAGFSVGDAETAIRRIGWDTNRAWVEFSSAPSLAGHHVDFIELDGSVGLRLDVDDAATVATGGEGSVLVWGVCEQPWTAGDQLMLRISESGESLTGATNDATCDGAAVSLTVPLQTAEFAPTADAYIQLSLAPLGGASGCGTDGLWACLDEAKSDGDESMVYLFRNGALRVGFTVGSDDVSSALVDVRFEASVRTQSGTLNAGAYGFTVYSGGGAVATASGEALGAEWTDIVVADPSIASALSTGVSDVGFQVNGPSSAPRLHVSRVRMVVDYSPAAGS